MATGARFGLTDSGTPPAVGCRARWVVRAVLALDGKGADVRVWERGGPWRAVGLEADAAPALVDLVRAVVYGRGPVADLAAGLEAAGHGDAARVLRTPGLGPERGW